MSFFQRLSGVYFEPAKTFRDINLKSSWIGIFIVMAVLAIAFTYFLQTRADMEALTRKTLESLPTGLSQEQIDKVVEAQAQQRSTGGAVVSAVLAPITSLIGCLIMAGIFLVLFLVMGAQMKYKKALAITIWGLAPPSILHQLLSIIVLFIKEPGTVDASEGAVIANLGPLVDSKAHAVVNSIVSSLDLFTIWGIVLLSIGFAAISDRKLKAQKAAGGIVTLWIVYILIKAGYHAVVGK